MPEEKELVTDPVCGMELRKDEASVNARWDGVTYFFCADQCREQFDKSPASFARKVA